MTRLAITGVGVVAPNGVGTAEQWKATLARQSGIALLPDGVSGASGLRVAGVVADYEPDDVPERLRVQTDRWTWFCLSAAGRCLADAEFDRAGVHPHEVSVVTSSSTGGNTFGQRELQSLWARGPRQVTAYQSIAWFYAASTGQLAIRHGFKGPCGVVVADGGGGLVAAASAARTLRAGRARAALVAGAEAPLSPYSLVCHTNLDTLSRSHHPTGAYRPFAEPATGGVLGEGGAALLLEPLDRLADRTTAYAELASVACTHDAHHRHEPPPTPAALVAAIRTALHRARTAPDDVDLVFVDANGARTWDRLETAALREVFGRPVPVTAPKTLTGRLNSGAAVLDLAWAAQALRHDVVPPSADGTGDLVDEARFDTGLATVLVIARGVGGFNAAAVLTSLRTSR